MAANAGDDHGVRDERTEADRHADEQRGPNEGLGSDEAASRREHYGRNAVEEERRSVLVELLSHFWGPIPWMIEAALVLTAVTGRWADFGIILALLVLNGGVGFWEEHQAQNAMEALKQRLATRADVKRDGSWTTLPTEELVPGDLVRVGRGEIVPADGRVVEESGEADESVLTGESLPVAKEQGDDVYSGTAIARGDPVMRVLATGEQTEFGRTAELAGKREPTSHFQQAIIRIGKYLIALAVGLVALIVVVSLLRGTGTVRTLEFALVVIIASIPVALPAVLSVTMAVGARYLAKREAVVTHLPVVEEMAGVDVLCADKTGTITKNELAVADVATIEDRADREQVLLDAAFTVERDTEDPIDRAVLEAADAGRLEQWQPLDFTPFDSTRKYAHARMQGPDGARIDAAKGAVQAILDLAGADSAVTERVSRATDEFADHGYRALAVARSGDDGWRVTGVLGLQDPPREDSRDTLLQASRMGLTIKMVTGDRREIAGEIAREVGMGDSVLDAGQLQQVEGADLARAVWEADGFAQVVPEDKYRIVEALQDEDHIVAMTGDGVNDTPALQRSDAGMAVSGATGAARAAADLVLLAPGLSTIIEAIHRSRVVFRRMKNYAIYRITETIRIVIFVTITILAFAFFPVTPIQVVLLAILNDAAILSIAYDRVRPSTRPERWDLAEVMSVAAVLGLTGVASSVLLVWLGQGPLDLSETTVQTLVYLKLSVAGHFTVFAARTRGWFWSSRPSWILLAAVVGTQIIATTIALTGFLMEPIGWDLVGLAWAWAAGWFLALDVLKVLAYQVLDRRGEAAPQVRS